MTLKDGKCKVSMKNRMLWLLLIEINSLYDAKFVFGVHTRHEDYLRLKKYLLNKINCD